MNQAATVPAKPETLDVNFEAIPGALKDHAQWLVWRYDWSAGREEWAKVPYRADGQGKASSNNPASWAAFAQAEAAYRSGGFDGIGFALGADDPFVIMDLDRCQGEARAFAADHPGGRSLGLEMGIGMPDGRGLALLGGARRQRCIGVLRDRRHGGSGQGS